jgi:hypothetical protein
MMKMSNQWKPTHILMQDFEFSSGEIYRKGTPVFMKPLHRKHAGFCCNVAMLDRRGRIRQTKDKVIAIFSKDHFKPLKNWFEAI